MPTPTQTQSKLALKLIRQGVPMHRVIARLGGGYTEAEINAGIEVMRAARNAARGPRGMDWSGRLVPARYAVEIPAHVIADRDRRLSLMPHPAAALMGDPLPGCSALERAPSIAPSFHRDPLDGLVFSRRRVKTGARYG